MGGSHVKALYILHFYQVYIIDSLYQLIIKVQTYWIGLVQDKYYVLLRTAIEVYNIYIIQ